jgi:hypothetical protein
MAENNEEKTLEQVEADKMKEREAKREIALKNLKASELNDLALAYKVNSSKDFGENDNKVIEYFKYFPAFNAGAKFHDFESGKEVDLIKNSIISSREDGRRYSGNFSEHKIIKDANSIKMESLAYVKVSDLLDLSGEKGYKIKEAYGNKYISELDEKDQQMILGTYMGYNLSDGLSDAYKKSAGETKKGLVSILTEPKEESKKSEDSE